MPRPASASSHTSAEKVVATPEELAYYVRSFGRLFWGEQPPFTSFGRGGRYFFNPVRVMENSSQHRQRSHWPLAFALVVAIGAALVFLIFWRIETWPSRTARQGAEELERVARSVAQAFGDIAQMQPRVTINNHVHLEQTSPAAELVLASRVVEVDHDFTHRWVGSTKQIRLRGKYRVKAGFDLRENVSADVSEERITVRVPPARILGIEQEKMEVLAFENGLWNRISAADLESEMAVMPRLARERADAAGLPAAAERYLREQLQERLGPGGRPLEVITTPPLPASKP